MFSQNIHMYFEGSANGMKHIACLIGISSNSRYIKTSVVNIIAYDCGISMCMYLFIETIRTTPGINEKAIA